MASIYKMVKDFQNKYPGTIAWRVKKHCEVIENYINPGEKAQYAFCAQKNDNWADWFSTCVVVLTDQRLLIGQKRVLWGSFYTQITPDMYNDMEIYSGLLFGRITIDTIKEEVILTNISKHGLDDIETNISRFMMEEKKKYKKREKENEEA